MWLCRLYLGVRCKAVVAEETCYLYLQMSALIERHVQTGKMNRENGPNVSHGAKTPVQSVSVCIAKPPTGTCIIGSIGIVGYLN